MSAQNNYDENDIVFADVLKTPSGRIISDPETKMPIMLAVRAPGQVAAQPDPSGVSAARQAASGNSNFDPRTGRFASGGKGKSNPALTVNNPQLWQSLSEATKSYIQSQVTAHSADSVILKEQGSSVNVTLRANGSALTAFTVESSGSNLPAEASSKNDSRIPDGVDPEVWNRRMDMVRAAARENDSMSEGDAKQFLKAHVKDISLVDVDSFLADVRQHRMDDLLDILDQQTRPKVVGMEISRRMVKVSAPKGFARRVFNGLSDEEVITLIKRLEGRGYDPEDLTKFVISGITSEERRTKLDQLYGQPKPKSGKKAKK